MNVTDFIGGRGEAIAFSHLARRCRRDSELPYFWPHFLGEKCETFDFFVELVDAGESTPIFFVQVKSTSKKLTRRQTPQRLRVEVSANDIRRIVKYPAPTYIIGVHEVEERAFIISVHGTMHEGISSISTAHELTCETLKRLWDEVREFWQGHPMTRLTSLFLN